MTNHILFYDFETSDMVDFRARSDEPHQPHIVQCAAKLVHNETRDCVATLNVMAQQGDWEIHPKALETHGITKDHANRFGFPEEIVVRWLYDLWVHASVRVGHNESFDARIMRIALKRTADSDRHSFSDRWAEGKAECTMRHATPLVKCPPTEKMLAAGRTHYKNPNLGEAYRHFFGKELDGAHDAMVDVEACEAIYWAIQDGQTEAATPDFSDLDAKGVFY